MQPLKDWLRTNSDVLKSIVSTILDSTKLLALIGTFYGFVVMAAYLRSVNAPFVLLEANSIFLLVSIAAVSTFFGIIIVGFIAFPAYMCYVPRKNYYYLFAIPIPKFVNQSLSLAQKKSNNYSSNQDQKLRSMKFIINRFFVASATALKKLAVPYLVFHSSSVTTIIAITMMVAIWPASALKIPLGWLIGTITGTGISYLIFRYHQASMYHGFATRERRFRLKQSRVLLLVRGSIWRGFWMGAWSTIAIDLLLKVWSSIYVLKNFDVSLSVFLFAFACIAIVLYTLLTSSRVVLLRVIVVIVTSPYIISGICFPSMSGRVAVRSLGIGGGIPIEFIARTMNDGEHGMTGRSHNGCLILNVAGRFIIQKLDQLNHKNCDQDSSDDAAQFYPMFTGITVFPSQDVLLINRFEADRLN